MISRTLVSLVPIDAVGVLQCEKFGDSCVFLGSIHQIFWSHFLAVKESFRVYARKNKKPLFPLKMSFDFSQSRVCCTCKYSFPDKWLVI